MKQAELNLNLGSISFLGLILIVSYSFLGRGLFFKPELLIGLIGISAVFAFAAVDIAAKGESDLYRVPVDFLVTALALFYLLSLYNAVSKPDAVIGALKNVGYLMVYITTVRAVRSWRGYRNLLGFVFIGGVVVALIGLLSAAGIFVYPGAFEGKTIFSTIQYSNALAVFLVCVSFIGLSLWATAEHSPLKDLWYINGLLLLNITLLGTGSRAVWMMYPLLLIGWFFGLRKKSRNKWLLRVSYVLIVSVIVSKGFYSRVESKHGTAAFLLLVGGVLIALACWMALRKGNRFVQRQHTGGEVKKFWQVLGIVYLAVVLGVYTIYAVSSLPGGFDKVMPATVTQQMTNVSSDDHSFQVRFVMFGDALKIAKDYPLTGAGTGGWNALYHEYRSVPYNASEVHNHFLQVMVDAGIAAFLIYIGIWGLMLYSAYRLTKHFRRDANWPLVWGVTIALLAIMLHSAFDFDLSIPSMSILAWMLFGLMRNGRLLARSQGEGLPLKGGRRWIPLVLGPALAVVMTMISYQLYIGGEFGATGAQALAAGKIETAAAQMQQAIAKDPYSGSYPADMAKIELVYYLQNGDKKHLDKGLKLAKQAIQMEPHNIRLRESSIRCYLSVGMIDEAIGEAEQVVAANPLEVKAYELLADTCVDAAMYYRKKSEIVKSLVYLNKVAGIPVQLDKRARQVGQSRSDGYRYIGMLQPSSRIKLSLGQSYLLIGRVEDAVKMLTEATYNEKTKAEATVWLVSAYMRNNQPNQAKSLIEKYKSEEFVKQIQQVEWVLENR